MEGNFIQNTGRANNYLYNGKELDTDFGLNWYHYGARMYDPAIGRFTGVDPISDRFPHLSTFNYASNNPIVNIDFHGLQGVNSNTGEIVDEYEVEGSGYVEVTVGGGLENRESSSLYTPLLPLPQQGLFPVQATTATLIAFDIIQAGDMASDILSPAKGLFKGGLKKLFRNIVKFAKKKRRKGKEHSKNASEGTRNKHESANARRDKEQKRADEKEAGTKSTKEKKSKNQRRKEDPDYKRKGPKDDNDN